MTPLKIAQLAYPNHICKPVKPNTVNIPNNIKHSKEPEYLINKYVKNYERG